MKKTIAIILVLILSATLVFACIGCNKQIDANDYFTAEEITAINNVTITSKGTVIAYGGGFDQNEDQIDLITQKSLDYALTDNPKVLYMTSGHNEEFSEEDEIYLSYHRLGCEVDTLFPTQATSEEIITKIGNADIIYETGGNLNYLTTTWKEAGVFAEMRKAFERGAVLIGVSTGAMCWAEEGYDNSLEELEIRVVTDFPFIGKENKYGFFEATGILPFCLCPHFDNIAYCHFNGVAKKLDRPSIALDNGTALIYRNGEYSTYIDPTTPNRKAYLYYPDRGIVKVDVTNDTTLLNYVSKYWKSNNTDSYLI